MKRLVPQSRKNSPEAYDEIYEKRASKGPDSYDMKRWGKLIRQFTHGDLIDLGCLDSEICNLVYKRPDTTYTGVDMAAEAVYKQRKKFKGAQNVYFIPADIYELPFQDEAFDYAVLGEVIEHLDEPQLAINEAVRVLRRGGTLAVSTPFNEAVEPGAVDNERHLWSFDENDMHMLLDKFGTVKTTKIGSEYFPKYVYHFPTLFAYLTKK